MSTDNVPLWAGFGANFGLLVVSILPMLFALNIVPKHGQTIAVSSDQAAHGEGENTKDKVVV